MTVFTCNNDFISMMTCIYDAWASKLGHDNVRLVTEPILSPELFCDYVHVDPCEDKAEKVVRSIRLKISDLACIWVFYVTCSDSYDKLDLIYRFLIKGFKVGGKITELLQDPIVSKMAEIRLKVSNESHLFREFVRFSSIDNKLYISHIEPKCDVLTMVAAHFNDRMPSEYWIIIDDVRGIAAVHPINEPFFLRYLDEEEITRLSETEKVHDCYVDLWKTYFSTIAIEARTNYVCQRTHFPIWMRKHVTEFIK